MRVMGAVWRRLGAMLLYAGLTLARASGDVAARLLGRAEKRAAGPFEPGVSVIIPERGNGPFLAECLEKALSACRKLSEPSEVIVVVNGSPASAYHALVRRHKQIRWLFFERPLWYCGAVRKGIEAARYDWVYLLNSDMLLDASALESLMKWRSAGVFAIASQVFFPDPGKRREETGWTMFRTTDGPIEILDAVPGNGDNAVRGTFYAGGGASLFRRTLLEDLARRSSVYVPFYWEDVEWGQRAWTLGYASLYCPASKAWHLHRMTNRRYFPEAEIDRILTRNRYVFHLRNGSPARSFGEFRSMLFRLDKTSLNEILGFARMARIISGRFQSCRLPAGHIALERTWRLRYGAVEQDTLEPKALV